MSMDVQIEMAQKKIINKQLPLSEPDLIVKAEDQGQKVAFKETLNTARPKENKKLT